MLRDVEILLEMKKKIDRGEYNDNNCIGGDTEHKIQQVMIIPVHTLDKIILDALHKKNVDE